MLIAMGANSIKANGTHLFRINKSPINTSSAATMYNTYPVLSNELIKFAAAGAISNIGINGTNLLIPNTSKVIPNKKRKIVVKVEFI
ncbi:hypothetical protein ULMA_07080 [Patiriisocius marinus]|uniref:Uncharacterized protein n=1 Tax=Patiriisocius marinus TaxID=1397112 RepID=A0A5J4IXQ4_9FLAO|nr:hypothetical protein ULMA_07080 [Patiriisocius marinus]